ncbi:MAG: hypothetical protein R2865_15795 [Deinococcales bacterium]
MAREYRRERYMEIVGEIKVKIPEVVLSTDIIVGFPGESEDDFEATLSLYAMRLAMIKPICLSIHRASHALL